LIYKAENVDTDKALEYIQTCLDIDMQRELRESAEVRKYHEGYRDGIEVAKSIFGCANFEKDDVGGDKE